MNIIEYIEERNIHDLEGELEALAFVLELKSVVLGEYLFIFTVTCVFTVLV